LLGKNQDLYSKGLIARDIHTVSGRPIKDTCQLYAKIRYRSSSTLAVVAPIGEGRLRVIFEAPQWAITPGQSVVFYDNDILIGGGIIERGLA